MAGIRLGSWESARPGEAIPLPPTRPVLSVKKEPAPRPQRALAAGIPARGEPTLVLMQPLAMVANFWSLIYHPQLLLLY
jgi:hypothetical protein